MALAADDFGARRTAALVALIAVLAFLSVYPLPMLLYGSLHSTPPGMAGTFNRDGYQQVLTQQSLITLPNTVGISLAKTIRDSKSAMFSFE
jgi:iron(III) transport system permease protein